MNLTDKERVIERYNARLNQYGYDIRTLASGTEERRRQRFQILCEVGLVSGCSVLDVGCGFGDFYAYLQAQQLAVRYVGYDINPNLIAIAQERHPTGDFAVKDIESEPFPEFDFIVSSSTFNLRLQEGDNYAWIETILQRCYSHAQRGVAIDFMSSYVDFQAPEAFHYSPERMFTLAKQLTKRVCLRHDYPLFEFCLYLYPDFRGWRPA